MDPSSCRLGGCVQTIRVPGGTVPVETLGSGPPLLLLHGWTLDRRMWQPQLPLTESFTLVAIDRRGFGQATAPPDLAAEPDDILRVADALGLAHFHLLGMSQGGRVALAFAARSGERLLSLTLQGTALDDVPATPEQVPLEAMAIAARAGDLATTRSLWSGHRLMRLVEPTGAPLLAAMLADYAARDLLAPASSLPATVDMITGLEVVVTAIVGSDDTAQRHANNAALVEARARPLVVPGGHLCHIDDPDAFNAVLRARLISG